MHFSVLYVFFVESLIQRSDKLFMDRNTTEIQQKEFDDICKA